MVSSGVRLVFGDPRLRTLMLLAWLAAFYTVPEGLAAPYAQHIGVGAVAPQGPAEHHGKCSALLAHCSSPSTPQIRSRERQE